ncbi:hypothetical protein B566_EDAN007331 [Ephemera danica]|nr:hypothetical protein B566_EDAN007331 [Ephemera danica]
MYVIAFYLVQINKFCIFLTILQIMRKLLGTHLGHSALLHMCRLLQSESSSVPTTAPMLRGAVFHVSMGMWGSQRVTSLHTTAAAVLPAFVQALRRSHSELVAYEVVLCVRRLVTQSPQALTDPAWDCVLAILEEAVAQAHLALAPELHGAISDVETQFEKGEFRGDVPRFFSLVESCSTARPELSVLRLLNHLAVEITPTMPEWLTRLRSLLDQYFWQDTRTNVRVKALDVLSVAVHSHRALYEDELVECVLSLQLQDAIKDKDTAVRNAVVQLLVSLALETESKRCIELLDLIEKFLNHPFEVHELEGSVVMSEAEALDVKSAALGLIKIFQSKTYQLPSSHAIRAYRALVSHLEAHYHQPKVFEKCNATRFLIFKCFLQIRADSLYHIGMPETLSLHEEETSSPPTSPLRFSSYLAVDHRHGERPSSAQPAPTPAVVAPQIGSASPPQSQQQATPAARPTEKVATLQTQTGSASPPQQQQPAQPAAPPPLPAPVVTHLSLQHACKAVIVCLNKEKDWRVLSLVLRELPRVLQNKALVLARHGNDVEYLAAALCAMVSEKSHNENLRNAPPKFSRSDYQALVLASLGPLASYPLEPALQQKLVKCLQVGLASRCAGSCVSALTLCTLEMRDTMYKLLPEVLLNLSKISATVLVAIPILEFLSTLTRLPKVFASFVGDQYMSVFAIALPYTNPFKYNHYTVSLAHHVIAVWFLKCRLPFRRDFVKFIITGLKANVLVPFEEGKKPELVNEDSSSRKRSSSLTEQVGGEFF